MSNLRCAEDLILSAGSMQELEDPSHAWELQLNDSHGYWILVGQVLKKWQEIYCMQY